MAWFDDLSRNETHTAVSYDLEVSIDPAGGSIDVAGTVRLALRQAPAGGGDATREACFLLSPGLDIVSPLGASGGGHPALRRITLSPGQTELRLAYRGRLPAAWITPASTELALYSLWFPLFSSQLQPFGFRVLVRVPQDSVTAATPRPRQTARSSTGRPIDEDPVIRTRSARPRDKAEVESAVRVG
jgi:hypothetical protein